MITTYYLLVSLMDMILPYLLLVPTLNLQNFKRYARRAGSSYRYPRSKFRVIDNMPLGIFLVSLPSQKMAKSSGEINPGTLAAFFSLFTLK